MGVQGGDFNATQHNFNALGTLVKHHMRQQL
jgi:hypothetical protein